MEEFCQNPLCENRAAEEVLVSVEAPGDQAKLLCAACEEAYTWGVQQGSRIDQGMRIDPPGEEMGPEPLYSVVYIIDVNAADVHGAAEYAHRIMTDPDSMRPVLIVIDSKGGCTTVDLSEDDVTLDDAVSDSKSKEENQEEI